MSAPSQQPPGYVDAVRMAAEARAANQRQPTAHPQQPYHMPYTAARVRASHPSPVGPPGSFSAQPSQPLPPPGQGMNHQYIQMLQHQIQHLQMQMRQVQAAGIHPPASAAVAYPPAYVPGAPLSSMPHQQQGYSNYQQQHYFNHANQQQQQQQRGGGGNEMYGGYRMPAASSSSALPVGTGAVYGTPSTSVPPPVAVRQAKSPPPARPAPRTQPPVPCRSGRSQTVTETPSGPFGWDGRRLAMPSPVAVPPPRPLRADVSPPRVEKRIVSPPQSPKCALVSPRRDGSDEGPTRAQEVPVGRPRSATEPPPRPERRPSFGKPPAHITRRPLPEPQPAPPQPTALPLVSPRQVRPPPSPAAKDGKTTSADGIRTLKRPPSASGIGRPLPVPLKASTSAGRLPPSRSATALLSPRHVPLKEQGAMYNARAGGSPPPVAPRQRSQTLAGSLTPVVSPRPERRQSEGAKQLPGSLRDEIHKFQMEDYAKQFFRHHKKGHIFRRKIPFAEMLKWSKDPIPSALLSDLSDKHQREAVEIFKCIQLFMKEGIDKKTGEQKKEKQKKTESTKSRMAQTILAKGLSVPELRDETYCQLCKQLTNNPSIHSVLRGWELFAITLEAFPPTKDLEPYIRWFLYATCKQPIVPGDSRKLPLFAAHCLRRYDAVWRAKGIVRMPTIAEIKRAKLAPFRTSMFGGDLHEMMEEQRQTDPELLVPRVLLIICSNVLESRGHLEEGIFRISANTTEMYELLIRLENRVAALPPNPSPHVPAALLKCWISELLTSLIPHDCYDALLAAKDDTAAIVRLVQEQLPDKTTATPCSSSSTSSASSHPSSLQVVNKMSERNLALIFSPNVFRCPYDEPRVQIFNTKVESAVLESIIVDMPIPKEHQLLSVAT